MPKTSPLGLQYFAHASNTCGSAPEGIWHQQAKEAVAAAARQLGYRAIIERPGSGWTADVWVEHPDGAAVVECQHSYQHLRDYVRRQRARTDFKGLKTWPADEGNLLPDFPAAALILEPAPAVRGTDLAEDVAGVLAAFLEKRFLWAGGRWCRSSVGLELRLPIDQRLNKNASSSLGPTCR